MDEKPSTTFGFSNQCDRGIFLEPLEKSNPSLTLEKKLRWTASSPKALYWSKGPILRLELGTGCLWNMFSKYALNWDSELLCFIFSMISRVEKYTDFHSLA